MFFGRRVFLGFIVDPSGGAAWFANVQTAVTPVRVDALLRRTRALSSPGEPECHVVAYRHREIANLVLERTFEIAYASTHFFRFAADQRDGLVDCVL
jgi:hypothetical protein